MTSTIWASASRSGMCFVHKQAYFFSWCFIVNFSQYLLEAMSKTCFCRCEMVHFTLCVGIQVLGVLPREKISHSSIP